MVAPKPKRAATKKRAAIKETAPRHEKLARNATAASDPTDDEIRLRAYFISEQRAASNVPGDSSADWLEAKRQLIAESRAD